MIVVSDTSPFFYLHLVGKLNLLRQLYGHVILTPAVVAELQEGAAQGFPIAPVDQLDWVQVRAVQVPDALRKFSDLGPGETEALALALEEPNCIVLLDDGWARQVARVHQLQVTGTGGVLLAAKSKGLLPLVEPVLQAILARGFRLHASVLENLLREAGEL